MPDYVNKALARLHHYPPINPHNYPHLYNAPVHSQRRQFVIPNITNKKLTPTQLKHCQEFCGFSIIISKPFTTPYKILSAPFHPPLQPAHGRISNL